MLENKANETENITVKEVIIVSDYSLIFSCQTGSIRVLALYKRGVYIFVCVCGGGGGRGLKEKGQMGT